MNEKSLRRLLQLFPVQALKAEWKFGGKTKEDIIRDIVSKVHPDNIAEFVRIHMGLTKQHVYLFSHNVKKQADLPATVFAEFKPAVVKHGNPTEFFYLVPLQFTYVAGTPPKEGTISFPWPIKVVFRSNLVEIHITTMEKDISAYLDGQAPLYSVRRTIENTDLLTSFKNTVAPITGVTPLDINKAVKHLWSQDMIDAPRGSWKESTSTRTQAMDGDYLLKKDNHEAYKEAIKAPLLKTIFRASPDHPGWPEILMVDATNGEIGITRFSKSEKEVDHAVGEILKYN